MNGWFGHEPLHVRRHQRHGVLNSWAETTRGVA
jgi:omega-hydroxypalmitate O-feruloyl transferase